MQSQHDYKNVNFTDGATLSKACEIGPYRVGLVQGNVVLLACDLIPMVAAWPDAVGGQTIPDSSDAPVYAPVYDKAGNLLRISNVAPGSWAEIPEQVFNGRSLKFLSVSVGGTTGDTLAQPDSAAGVLAGVTVAMKS